MDSAVIRMTEDAVLKLYRMAEEFFGRPENKELFEQLAKQDRQEK